MEWLIIIVFVVGVLVYYKSPTNNTQKSNYNHGASDYEHQEIIRTTYQVLETLRIIKASKNTNTVRERLDFLQNSLYTLANYQDKEFYLEITVQGVYSFQDKYSDYKKDDTDFAILEHPKSALDDIFYFNIWSTSMYNAFVRSLNDELEKIKTLKTEKGKYNRLSKKLDELNDIIDDVENVFKDVDVLNELESTKDELIFEIEKYSK